MDAVVQATATTVQMLRRYASLSELPEPDPNIWADFIKPAIEEAAFSLGAPADSDMASETLEMMMRAAFNIASRARRQQFRGRPGATYSALADLIINATIHGRLVTLPEPLAREIKEVAVIFPREVPRVRLSMLTAIMDIAWRVAFNEIDLSSEDVPAGV